MYTHNSTINHWKVGNSVASNNIPRLDEMKKYKGRLNRKPTNWLNMHTRIALKISARLGFLSSWILYFMKKAGSKMSNTMKKMEFNQK